MAIVELVGIGLHHGDQLGQRLRRKILAHQDGNRRIRQLADVLEIIHRIIGELRIQTDGGRMCAHLSDKQRVTIGFGFRRTG